MYKYKIVKKGRKWFQAEEAEKGYKAQIEINDISKDWIEGQIVEFEGKYKKQTSGGYTKVYIYPCTPEQKEQHKEVVAREREQKEIEKYLSYVEKNAKEYVYWNGVEKLRSMNLNDEQKERLKAAIQEGIINKTKKKLKDYFRYIKNAIVEGHWYSNGESVIKEGISTLQKYGIDTKEYEGKLEELKAEYKQAKEQREIEDAKRYFIIRNVTDNKNIGFEVGEIIKSQDGRLGKVIKAWKYYEEDTMSLGYMIDGGWIICAKCDTYAVTEEEKRRFEEKEKRYEERRVIERKISEKEKEIHDAVYNLVHYIRNNGDYPEGRGIQVEGIVIYDSFDIYGGGQRIVVDGVTVWGIQNNGGDGDDWSYNNIRTGGAGAIGYKMQINDTCKEFIEKINKLKEELECLQN